MKTSCPNCQTENAQIHPLFGAMPGLSCQKKQKAQSSPGSYIEFTSESIKQDRVNYADDILQPYRSGEVSKKYIQKYGTKNLDVSEKEIKKATDNPDVWSGESNSYYRE